MAAAVATSYFKTRIFADLVADITADDYAGILVPANVSLGLFIASITPTQDTVLGDLTVATFGGYALVPLTSWGIVRRDEFGNYSILANSVPFYVTGTPFTDVVYGAFLVDNTTTPDKLLLVQVFDSPVPMNTVAAGFNFSCEVELSATLTTGEGCLC